MNGAQPGDAQEQALRVVLVLTVSCEEAGRWLAPRRGPADCRLWPSSVYVGLTQQMLACPVTWREGAARLDRLLGPWLQRFETQAPIELAQALDQHKHAWTAPELAALLWQLLRTDPLDLGTLLPRLTAEVEIALLQNTLQRPASPHPQPGLKSRGVRRRSPRRTASRGLADERGTRWSEDAARPNL